MKYCPDKPISTTFAMNHHLVVLHCFIPPKKSDVKKIRPPKHCRSLGVRIVRTEELSGGLEKVLANWTIKHSRKYW